MRCFIGIDLSVEATKETERLQRIIKPHFVGKTTSSENLHLTLKFLILLYKQFFLLCNESYLLLVISVYYQPKTL
jgi:hypothetical protein